MLLGLGTSPERATQVVSKFRSHDEKILLEQQKLYGDERKLVNFSKEAARNLVELFRADKA